MQYTFFCNNIASNKGVIGLAFNKTIVTHMELFSCCMIVLLLILFYRITIHFINPIDIVLKNREIYWFWSTIVYSACTFLSSFSGYGGFTFSMNYNVESYLFFISRLRKLTVEMFIVSIGIPLMLTIS